MTGQQEITTVGSRLALKLLSDGDVAAVHSAALASLGGNAAAAEEALAAAPRAPVLGGRVEAHDVTLGEGRCRLAGGGPAARVCPREGGDPRPATAADLEEACRLADALPEVAVVSGPPARAAGETALGELAACLAATSKHVQAVALRTAGEARAAVRLAHAVAGSADEARRRPPLSLRAGGDGLDAALVFARAGLPVAVVAPRCGAAPGATAAAAALQDARPVSPADIGAALVRHHAAVLDACAAVQAAAPGAPFLYLADPALAGLPPAGPAAVIFQLAAVQLAARSGLPVYAAGLATSAHESDWQASTQGALATLVATAARADLTGGAGTLGSGAAFSLQQLVMDSEIFSWNAAIAAGIAVDDETIALDTIAEVGIGGNYLGQRHTRRHMKDVWRPRLLDRSMWDAWIASGCEGAYEKATALVEESLGEHAVEPLGDELRGTLARIVAEAGL
jgi:trimethylamine--corrinoid protein Co-methyltransferase